MNNSIFDLKKAFQYDAEEILSAHSRAKLIHSTKNIKSSGSEVEIKIRDIIEKRLPKKCSVGQGHIVNKWWLTSSQLDIILYDNINSTALFKSNDETSYYPFESVYGFGEVKSTFYKQEKPIEKFIGVVETIKDKFKRDSVINQEQDALFKFMFFVNSNDLNIEELADLYLKTENELLPNVICFLDRGVVVRTSRYGEEGPMHSFNYVLEIEHIISKEKFPNYWQFMSSGKAEKDNWFNLLIIQYLMTSFINLVKIKPTELLPYIQWALVDSQSQLFKKNEQE